MDRKRIQCLSNASQHVPIYLQPRYSQLLVENCDIFTPHLYLAAPQGVTPSEFREDLDIHKTRINGLSCGEESIIIRSTVLIQYQRVTDGQNDRRTDVQPISITCFSIADARKNFCQTRQQWDWSKVSVDGTRSWYLYRYYIRGFPDRWEISFCNRSVENCRKWVTEIWCEVSHPTELAPARLRTISQLGMPSGPGALKTFILANRYSTSLSRINYT